MIITVSKVSGEILQGAEELQWRLRASLMPASCLVHGFFDLITSCSVPPDEDQCARNTCEWFDDFNRHVCSLRSAYETRTCTSNLWQPSSWYKQRSLGILRCSWVCSVRCKMLLSSFDTVSQLISLFSSFPILDGPWAVILLCQYCLRQA